jgi:hypothetical protein
MRSPRRPPGDQLELIQPLPTGLLTPTSALARDRRRDQVLTKVRYVRGFFPELDQLRLRVGLTRRAAGMAELEGNTLWLNPHRLALHIIAHELTHLLQGRRLIPGGERACDLHAMARDPSLVDVPPCYVHTPTSMADTRGWLRPGAGRLLCELAREAIARRSGGERRYIRWLEVRAAERWREMAAAPAAGAVRGRGRQLSRGGKRRARPPEPGLL